MEKNNKVWKTSFSYLPINYEAIPITIENTIQQIQILNNLNGEKIRVKFSNLYGIENLLIKYAIVAKRIEKQSKLENITYITFNGVKELNLNVNEECYSDELDFTVKEGESIVILTYVPSKIKLTSGCSLYSKRIVQVKNYPGKDFLELENIQLEDIELQGMDLNKISQNINSNEENSKEIFFYGVTAIDVLTEEKTKTIVAFGDSITHQSYWSSELTKILYEKYSGSVSLINCGISGNRILRDSSKLVGLGDLFGEAGIKRFERDIFSKGKVDTVIVLEGVNDLIHPGHEAPKEDKVTSEEIIEGLKYYANKAHEYGVKIIACTILPFTGYNEIKDESIEQTRREINEWIRTNNIYDDYFDFDSFLRSENPSILEEKYDSGDHLHPSELGGIKIAESIEIEKLMK